MKVGLVGYRCNTGLGELNRQLFTHQVADCWLVYPHSKVHTVPIPEGETATICYPGDVRKLAKFVTDVDLILCCELPYFDPLPQLCKAHHRPFVCIPMLEWLPASPQSWIHRVDLFICPTEHTYNSLHPPLPSALFRWPCDLQRFPFKPRTTCRRFLFLNGHGGWRGRKGEMVIRRALELWPEMPLTIRSQVHRTWPDSVRILPPTTSNADLYSEGDVLLLPHRFDGLCLEALEALTSGLPVISTDGNPWNEFPSLAKIAATCQFNAVASDRAIEEYSPSAESLVESCKQWLGKDISRQSQEGRVWAVSRNWENQRATIRNLLQVVCK